MKAEELLLTIAAQLTVQEALIFSCNALSKKVTTKAAKHRQGVKPNRLQSLSELAGQTNVA